MIIEKQDVVKLKLTLNEDEIEKLMQVVWFALDYQSEQKKKGITEMSRSEEEFAVALHKITYDITFRNCIIESNQRKNHTRVDYEEVNRKAKGE